MTTSTLGELLEKKAESYRSEAEQNKLIIDDWSEAISRLHSDIKGWLSASDPKGILKIEEKHTDIVEPNVGTYVAPRLDFQAFGKWVGLIPKALRTIKSARPPRADAPVRATGRVDLTDELVRYVLYRFTDTDGDSWFIEGPNDGLQALTRERFEQALMGYFQ